MASDRFPAGLRVLVVDDDVVCLKVLEQMLRRCSYHVKTCSRATSALNVLRERKDCFDVILSDVHMPDMDGFKLLELVGLEMDLPVIMMSADTSTSAVMRGIRHGACDYLIKPIREEELKNIWQHVVRKKFQGNKELEHSSSLEDNDRHKRGSDDAEYASSVNEETDLTLKAQRKRSNHTEDDDGELDNDDPATSKKPRVVWSVELHQQFVSAVNQLGHDKAVPKRILELMNVPGLTRENVASHLQKFRLYLRRLSGVAHQQGGIPNSFSGTVESDVKLGSPLGRFDIQSLAASGQIPPQTLAALQAELFGRPAGHLVLPAMDQSAVLQTTLHGSKCIPVEPGVAFGQPLMKFQSNLSKSFPQNAVPLQDASSALGTWSSNCLGTVGSAANLRGFNTQNGNVVMAMLQQQHQQRQQYQHQQQQASLLPEPNHSVNVQPSCLVPSQSSVSFQGENSPASFNQNCSLDQSSAFEYSLLSPRPNNSSLSIGHGPVVDLKTGVPNAATAPGSIPPSVSSCSVPANSSTGQQVQFSISGASLVQGHGPNIGDIKDPRTQSGEVLDQGPLRNLGFVDRGTYIPSRFAVDELESPTSNVTHMNISRENDGNRVKREQNLLLLDNVRVGIPTLPKFSPHDIMRVFSE